MDEFRYDRRSGLADHGRTGPRVPSHTRLRVSPMVIILDGRLGTGPELDTVMRYSPDLGIADGNAIGSNTAEHLSSKAAATFYLPALSLIRSDVIARCWPGRRHRRSLIDVRSLTWATAAFLLAGLCGSMSIELEPPRKALIRRPEASRNKHPSERTYLFPLALVAALTRFIDLWRAVAGRRCRSPRLADQEYPKPFDRPLSWS